MSGQTPKPIKTKAAKPGANSYGPGNGHPADTLKFTPEPSQVDSDHSKKVRDALDQIAKVHSIHGLKGAKITASHDQGNSTLGAYNPTTGNIHLNSSQTHPELTTVHEIGHLLDHNAFPSKLPGFQYRKSDEFDGLRKAIESSPTGQKLNDVQGAKTITHTTGTGTYEMPANTQHLKYLHSRTEQFARAYAQYVAVRSGHPGMLKGIAETRKKAYGQYQQWGDEEFKPIAAEFDKIFKARGMRK